MALSSAEFVNKVIGNLDDRTPNQIRLDKMIKLLEAIGEDNAEVLSEMKQINKNLTIVGAALLKLVENKSKVAKK